MRDLVSGTDQERIQDRGFLSVIGNRDVWYVACLFAKFGFFLNFTSSSIVTALLRHWIRWRWSLSCRAGIVKNASKALWSAEFSVVWRLGDTNKWTFLFEKQKHYHV
jgi:hypothetical protein